MLKKEFKDNTNVLYKKLILIPWKYEFNNNIYNEIFDDFIKKKKDDKYEKLLLWYLNYFIKEWVPFFEEEEEFNYDNISKIQRSKFH